MSTVKITTLSTLDGTYTVPAETLARGACRAWCNFNGTGTVAIRASFNVSSITDNGTGDYTVNFTTAMEDADYSATGMVRNDNTNGNRGAGGVQIKDGFTPTASALRLLTAYGATASSDGAADDVPFVCIAVFR